MTSVWHAKEPFKSPVCFLSREWPDLSPAVIRKRKLRHISAWSWCSSFSHWCSPCSQFLDLMDTIDKQREEIARSGRWVEFLSAFCFLIAELGPSHFLTEISHIFFLSLPPQMQDICGTSQPATGSIEGTALYYEFSESKVWRREMLTFSVLSAV